MDLGRHKRSGIAVPAPARPDRQPTEAPVEEPAEAPTPARDGREEVGA